MDKQQQAHENMEEIVFLDLIGELDSDTYLWIQRDFPSNCKLDDMKRQIYKDWGFEGLTKEEVLKKIRRTVKNR